MSGFGFKLKIRYEDKQIEFKPFGNFALVRDEIIKAFGDDVESLVLRYNNLHNKIMFVRNEMEYIEMINNFTNELYYPDLEYAELQLVEYVDDDEAEDVNDDENEIDDDNNNNNNNDDDNDDIDESTRNKHSNKFNEQKRIYYIKEKKEMQREEQRKYELDTNTNTNTNTNTTNEHSKSKKKSKGK